MIEEERRRAEEERLERERLEEEARRKAEEAERRKVSLHECWLALGETCYTEIRIV